MGIFSRAVERRERIEPRIAAPAAEMRAGRFDPSWAALSANGGWGAPGEFVTGSVAQTVGCVTACVELIAGAISALPVAVLGPDGSPAPAGMGLALAIERPNDRQGWPAFMRGLVGDLLLTGNALVYVVRDGRGGVAELIHAPWSWMSQQVVTSTGGEARRVYEMATQTPASALLGLPRRMLDSDVLHLMQRSDDGGVTGRSVLARAGGVVHRARAADDTASAIHRNGLHSAAYISSPEYISDDLRAHARETLETFTGALNAGRVPVLEGGWKVEPIGIKPEDMQLLQSRQFKVEEIARLFGVPTPMIGGSERIPADLASYTSAFAQTALAPIVCEIESQFSQLVPRGYRLAIDLSGLLRGAFSGQAAALAVLKQSGIITSNDARAELDFGPHPDGDGLAAGPPPSWPADGAGLPHLGPSPGPGGALPNIGSNEDGGSANAQA